MAKSSITGILIDFVKCVREQVLMGNTVKIDNLAIFKATVEANGLETMYDPDTDKVASATIGNDSHGDGCLGKMPKAPVLLTTRSRCLSLKTQGLCPLLRLGKTKKLVFS